MKKTNSNSFFKNPIVIFALFALAIFIVCFFVFIFNYKSVYQDSTNGGFISPSVGVKLYHILVSLVFAGIAFFIKAIMKERIFFVPLLIIALVLPSLCYTVNYDSLKKNGSFYFLVDEGGPFHFIVIGDYNFDGVNDDIDRIRNEERTISSCTYSSSQKLALISVKAKGVGQGIDGIFCSEGTTDIENSQIVLHLQKSNSDIKEVEIEIGVVSGLDPAKVSFSMVDGETESPLPCTVNASGKLVLSFDSNFCQKLQQASEKEFFNVYIKYTIHE